MCEVSPTLLLFACLIVQHLSPNRHKHVCFAPTTAMRHTLFIIIMLGNVRRLHHLRARQKPSSSSCEATTVFTTLRGNEPSSKNALRGNGHRHYFAKQWPLYSSCGAIAVVFITCVQGKFFKLHIICLCLIEWIDWSNIYFCLVSKVF